MDRQLKGLRAGWRLRREQTGSIYIQHFIIRSQRGQPARRPLEGTIPCCGIQVRATGLAEDTKLSADSGGLDSPAMDSKIHALFFMLISAPNMTCISPLFFHTHHLDTFATVRKK